jgi:hypothetical protein
MIFSAVIQPIAISQALQHPSLNHRQIPIDKNHGPFGIILKDSRELPFP